MHKQQNNSTWYVLGAGAIGVLWAQRLLENNIDCRLLLRPKYDIGIRPLSYTNLNNQSTSQNIRCHSTSQDIKISHLLVTTKSYQTSSALAAVRDKLSDDATVVLLQNGMGQQQQALDLLPKQAVFAATTTEGALLKAPLDVQHTGSGVGYFGPLSKHSVGCDVLEKLMLNIGLQKSDDIKCILWRKLVINAVINPLTAIHQCRNGELLSNPIWREETVQLCAEVSAIIEAIDLNILQTPLFNQVSLVAQNTAANYSSMQQDIYHCRPTEIDYISGYLLQQAEKVSVPTPLNVQLLQQIKALSATARL